MDFLNLPKTNEITEIIFYLTTESKVKNKLLCNGERDC